jgi:hypothetical protein
MPDADATFDYARAVNWQKHALSRTAAFGFRMLGYNPENMLRPHFLEDPKFAVTLVLLIITGMLVMTRFILFVILPRMQPRKNDPALLRQ